MAVTSKRECRLPKPGGTKITARAFDFCSFAEGAKLADIGCGTGEMLHFAKEHYGLNVAGIDADAKLTGLLHTDTFYVADAIHLPFEDETIDGLFYECSFSKMAAPDDVLYEASRVLVPNGVIVITDFYARGEEFNFNGVLGRVEKKETIAKRLTDTGFVLQLFEDYTDDMKALWAELIFQYGSEKLCDMTGIDQTSAWTAKCGYALFIAEKI